MPVEPVIHGLAHSIAHALVAGCGGAAATLTFLDADDTSYSIPLTFLDADDTSYTIPATFLDADDTSYSL